MKKIIRLLVAVCMLCGVIAVNSVDAYAEDPFEYFAWNGYAVITDYKGTPTSTLTIPSKTPKGETVVGVTGGFTSDACSVITKITIPDSVKIIDGLAFSETGYYKNESNWVDGMLYIGTNLVDCKPTKEGKAVIRPGTKVIATNAFANCGYIDSFSIPTSVSYIGIGAFWGSDYWWNKENWTDGMLYIDNCLIDCDDGEKTKIVVRPGTRVIADNALYGMEKLEAVSLPNSLVSINGSAFEGCTKLKDITVPSSVQYIGVRALGYVKNKSSTGSANYNKVAGFKISTICGSAAHTYAKREGFAYTLSASTGHKYNGFDKCKGCGKYAANINTSLPKMKINSLTKASKAFTVKWSKNSKVKGYQIRYSTKSDMSSAKTVTISKYKTTSKKIKNLKKKTKYYVMIRCYTVKNGKKQYGVWSAVKSVTTK